jgi:hypothetical protein
VANGSGPAREWSAGLPDEGRPLLDRECLSQLEAQVFTPAAKAVGIEKPRPYDLRHSFASLLFAEGTNPAEIAEQMGHSLQTLLNTYTHVIEELRGQPRRSAEALIREARDRAVPQKAPKASRAGSRGNSTGAEKGN